MFGKSVKSLGAANYVLEGPSETYEAKQKTLRYRWASQLDTPSTVCAVQEEGSKGLIMQEIQEIRCTSCVNDWHWEGSEHRPWNDPDVPTSDEGFTNSN